MTRRRVEQLSQMDTGVEDAPNSTQQVLYATASREFGAALDRLAAGYEADPEKRRDLRQDIHLQLWRSFAVFDERCSLKTWSFRVAHNTAVSYVNRERRQRVKFVSLEEVAETMPGKQRIPDIDQGRALDRLSRLILILKPLDRQILLSYLEDMDSSVIAEITGLSRANVATKVHRIKQVLARHFFEEQQNV